MNIKDLVLMKKLGPIRMALLRQGKIRQVILMSPELSPSEKAILIKEFSK